MLKCFPIVLNFQQFIDRLFIRVATYLKMDLIKFVFEELFIDFRIAIYQKTRLSQGILIDFKT